MLPEVIQYFVLNTKSMHNARFEHIFKELSNQGSPYMD